MSLILPPGVKNQNGLTDPYKELVMTFSLLIGKCGKDYEANVFQICNKLTGKPSLNDSGVRCLINGMKILIKYGATWGADFCVNIARMSQEDTDKWKNAMMDDVKVAFENAEKIFKEERAKLLHSGSKDEENVRGVNEKGD